MHLNYNRVLDERLNNTIFIIPGPLLICFMITYGISKDLNKFLPFPDQATPLTLKINLRIILGSKQEDVSNIYSL